MSDIEIAVIGGSGLYEMDGLTNVERKVVQTPFGNTSDEIMLGTLNGVRLAFLPRHGRGHVLSPNEVPYRANIYALKTLGIRYIIAVSACGSLREEFAPGHVVVPDGLVDFTRGKRDQTFFGEGLVAHVGVAQPYSPRLSEALAKATRASGGIVHVGATFITVEGPRFSTKAESNLFRQWGMGIIGMTGSPEAFLAAEAEIAYACMAHVTDYDVWHDAEEPVTVEMVIRILSANTRLAQNTIARLADSKQEWEGVYPEHNAMRDALSLVGDWGKIPREVKVNLAPLIEKYAK